ncbi:Tim44-like domain containing protein [Parasponia andersonii]|uniref:Large ribosomal subunit protein mL45 n=1 Tax=Parasponia andersonii TaxID=3476 RepID=A0A2P5CTP7_PARAD|nr:Tim44-like domain containing protein [Parasponia andersonii]
MAFRSLQKIRALIRTPLIRESSYMLGSSTSHSTDISNVVAELNFRKMSSAPFKDQNALLWTHRSSMTLRSAMGDELAIFQNDKRLVTTQAKAPSQARQMGAKVAVFSPGFVYEPYAPREAIPFWRRWFTRSGWRRTKDDIILELKSAYAIAKLRKSGYSKQLFYKEAVQIYKEIGVDRNDLNKVFVQLTIEFLTKQKFEAYDLNGNVVSGDKSKEVLVKDIWVFEKSLFHPGAYWRTSGKRAASSAKLRLEKTGTSKTSDPSSLGSLQTGQDDKKFLPIQGIAGYAVSSPPQVDKERNSELVSCAESEIAEDEAAPQPKAPKKMVSINDRDEEIHKIMKKRKKSRSFDKLSSFLNGEDESKPLKSILNVGSNLDEKDRDGCKSKQLISLE